MEHFIFCRVGDVDFEFSVIALRVLIQEIGGQIQRIDGMHG